MVLTLHFSECTLSWSRPVEVDSLLLKIEIPLACSTTIDTLMRVHTNATGDDICVASALTLLWSYNDVDGLHAMVQPCEVLFDLRATVATKAPSQSKPSKPAKPAKPEPLRDDGGGDEEDEEAEEGRVQRQKQRWQLVLMQE